MPALLLQKPSFKSKSKEHTLCLKRRLSQWENGDFEALISEARTIQSKLNGPSIHKSSDQLAKLFVKHMLNGKINAAIRLLDNAESGGVLPLTKSTLDQLKSLHPIASPADESVILNGKVPFVDPAMFNNIDESTIKTAAMRTKGAAGPSGGDSDHWRRILVSNHFGTANVDLRTSVASMARKLSTSEIHPLEGGEKSTIEAYIACRLIPLDKGGGKVRPIGIGEVLRRIIGKSIISIIKPDILDSAGSLQLCAGHKSGCEAAVHAMRDLYEEEENDALLLVDASNAFNSLNRAVLLHNIRYICPPMATYIRNCYSTPSRLFIAGGAELESAEGATQGDPLAMPGYGVGITPLFPLIRPTVDDDGHVPETLPIGPLPNTTKHVAFADDLAGITKLQQLRLWWDNVEKYGPPLGYHPKASKSWLIVKEDMLDDAKVLFDDTNINITTSGRPYLGSFVGSDGGKAQYIQELIQTWVEQLDTLSIIARSEPQAAYAAFVSGFQHKLTYHIRVTPGFKEYIKPVDHVINTKFIPALTDGHICTPNERELLALPVNLGGLGIPIFENKCDEEYRISRDNSAQLIHNIKQQITAYKFDNKRALETRRETSKKREAANNATLEQLRSSMNNEQLRANDLSQMKGASSWLTCLPLKSEDFVLNKREFSDALSLRYRWSMKRLPSVCPCGSSYTVDHALNCHKGGFINQRHDRVRNLFAKTMADVLHDVKVEPMLTPITGEQLSGGSITTDEARVDVSARSFWQDGQRAFFDVRVINPFAQRYKNQSPQASFITNEREKKRGYNQRIIQIEHGTFSPLVFSPYGGCGREAEKVISMLAGKIALKRRIDYGITVSWLRTKLSFTLLRSAILCIRGSRDWWRPDSTIVDPTDIEITNDIARISR